MILELQSFQFPVISLSAGEFEDVASGEGVVCGEIWPALSTWKNVLNTSFLDTVCNEDVFCDIEDYITHGKPWIWVIQGESRQMSRLVVGGRAWLDMGGEAGK